MLSLDACRQRLASLEANDAAAAFIRACELMSNTPWARAQRHGLQQQATADYALHELVLLPIRQFVQYSAILLSVPQTLSEGEITKKLHQLGSVADQILTDAHRYKRQQRPSSSKRYTLADSIAAAVAGQSFIMEGRLQQYAERGVTDARLLLYDGAIVSCTEAAPSIIIKLAQCWVVNSSQGAEASFMLLTPERSIHLVAASAVQHKEWMLGIAGAIAALPASQTQDQSAPTAASAHAALDMASPRRHSFVHASSPLQNSGHHRGTVATATAATAQDIGSGNGSGSITPSSVVGSPRLAFGRHSAGAGAAAVAAGLAHRQPVSLRAAAFAVLAVVRTGMATPPRVHPGSPAEDLNGPDDRPRKVRYTCNDVGGSVTHHLLRP